MRFQVSLGPTHSSLRIKFHVFVFTGELILIHIHPVNREVCKMERFQKVSMPFLQVLSNAYSIVHACPHDISCNLWLSAQNCWSGLSGNWGYWSNNLIPSIDREFSIQSTPDAKTNKERPCLISNKSQLHFRLDFHSLERNTIFSLVNNWKFYKKTQFLSVQNT